MFVSGKVSCESSIQTSSSNSFEDRNQNIPKKAHNAPETARRDALNQWFLGARYRKKPTQKKRTVPNTKVYTCFKSIHFFTCNILKLDCYVGEMELTLEMTAINQTKTSLDVTSAAGMLGCRLLPCSSTKFPCNRCRISSINSMFRSLFAKHASTFWLSICRSDFCLSTGVALVISPNSDPKKSVLIQLSY